MEVLGTLACWEARAKWVLCFDLWTRCVLAGYSGGLGSPPLGEDRPPCPVGDLGGIRNSEVARSSPGTRGGLRGSHGHPQCCSVSAVTTRNSGCGLSGRRGATRCPFSGWIGTPLPEPAPGMASVAGGPRPLGKTVITAGRRPVRWERRAAQLRRDSYCPVKAPARTGPREAAGQQEGPFHVSCRSILKGSSQNGLGHGR